MIKDRRRGGDRREIERLAVNIEIEWESINGKKQGSISDISTQGCFVLCSGDVEDAENIKIFLPLADGMKVQFWGVVVNHIYEIGFALSFVELSKAQKDFLDKLMERIRKS